MKKTYRLLNLGITTIYQLENLCLEDLSEVPSEKQVIGSIEPIVLAYFELQLKKGRLGEITALQLISIIKEIMGRFKKESDYRRRTLKEILEELQKQNGINVGEEE